MLQKKKVLLRLAPIALLALGACSENLDELRDTDPVGNEYTQILSKAYLMQADEESANMDYGTAEFLSEKGLRAAGGEPIFADSVANWDVPSENIQELAEARQLLREAYKDQLHMKYPELVASAQVSYDAWLASLYYGDDDDAEQARQDMVDALAELAVSVMEPEIEAMADEASAQEYPAELSKEDAIVEYSKLTDMAGARQEGFVFFQNGATALGEDDYQVIDQMAQFIADNGHEEVSVFGFGSRVGSQDVNLRVSQKRAEIVRDALMEALGDHAPNVRITAAGQGEAPANIPAEYARSAVIKVM